MHYPMYDTSKLVKPFADYGYFSNYSLFFNGSASTYIQNVGNETALRAVGGSFTIEFWIKQMVVGSSSVSVIMSNRGSSSGGWLFYIAGAATGVPRKPVFNTNGGSQAIANTALNIAEWTHVAATYTYGASNNAVVRIYINGTLDQTQTGMNTITTPNSGETIIGYEFGAPSAYILNGFLDEFRFWNVARTDSEIRDNYRKTMTGRESNLVVLMNAEEGAGNPRNVVTNTSMTPTGMTYSRDTPILDETTAATYLLPTLDKDVQTYYANVVGNGGRVSFKTLTWINEFVLDLKAKNVWDKINDTNVFCGGNLNAAMTKLKYKTTPYCTNVNFSEANFVERGSSGGLQASGSGKSVLLNYNGGYSSQSCHLVAYVRGLPANGVSGVYFGHEMNDFSYYTFLAWAEGGTEDVGVINSTSTNYTPNLQTQKLQGMTGITTNGSNTMRFYHNGVQLGGTFNNTDVTPITHTMAFLSDYYNGSFQGGTPRAGLFYSVGQGLSSADMQNFSQAIHLLQSRLGRQIA